MSEPVRNEIRLVILVWSPHNSAEHFEIDKPRFFSIVVLYLPFVYSVSAISLECFEKARSGKPLLPLTGVQWGKCAAFQRCRRVVQPDVGADGKKQTSILNTNGRGCVGLPEGFALLYCETDSAFRDRSSLARLNYLRPWITPRYKPTWPPRDEEAQERQQQHRQQQRQFVNGKPHPTSVVVLPPLEVQETTDSKVTCEESRRNSEMPDNKSLKQSAPVIKRNRAYCLSERSLRRNDLKMTIDTFKKETRKLPMTTTWDSRESNEIPVSTPGAQFVKIPSSHEQIEDKMEGESYSETAQFSTPETISNLNCELCIPKAKNGCTRNVDAVSQVKTNGRTQLPMATVQLFSTDGEQDEDLARSQALIKRQLTSGSKPSVTSVTILKRMQGKNKQMVTTDRGS
ncbi:unnamed protein product [Dicrocoelium dendriticum]|nr:unnamed protein product [Dicrocoelium dendriticum]